MVAKISLAWTEHVDHLPGSVSPPMWLVPFFPSPSGDDGYDIIGSTAVPHL
ncbi:MAG TPA: hypothetical protein VK070_02495 [Acidimicrobiia bacterium]|nr:hypothetical protein [Acidimicrobiia bacterium]